MPATVAFFTVSAGILSSKIFSETPVAWAICCVICMRPMESTPPAVMSVDASFALLYKTGACSCSSLKLHDGKLLDSNPAH